MRVYPADPARSEQLFALYKAEKRGLGLCTPGGLFAHGGTGNDLMQHSNIMQIDIDSTKPTERASKMQELGYTPNFHVKDWELVKRILSKFPFVSYCSLSVSGHGIFALVPIADYTKHEAYWHILQKVLFKRFGLSLDEKAKGVAHPRFVSMDENAFVNTDAQIFDFAVPAQQHIAPTQQRPPQRHALVPQTPDAETVAMFVDYIEAHRIDITANYGGSAGRSGKGWADIPPALYSVFGEAGEDFYHRVSQFHPEYSTNATAKKWNQNKHRSQIGVATFFMICKDYGVTWDKVRQYHGIGRTQVERTPPPRPSTPTATPSPSPTPAPSAASATTAAEPRIRYSSILPSPSEDVFTMMTDEEFSNILSPEAVAAWQAEHPVAPF